MVPVCILTLCGLPAAGKTCFISKFKQFLNSCKSDEGKCQKWVTLVVNYDHLLPKILCDECYDFNMKDNKVISWKSCRLLILKCLEMLITSLKESPTNLSLCISNVSTETDTKNGELEKYYSIESSFIEQIKKQLNSYEHINKVTDGENDDSLTYLIILDDNMWLRSMRYQVCQVARKCKCSFVQMFIPINASTSLQRNSNREQQDKVSDVSILKMAAALEEPDSSQKWEQFTFTWSASNNDDDDDNQLKLLKEFIKVSLDHPCTPTHNSEDDDLLKQARVATLTNVIHQSDIILRKLLSDQMSSLMKDKSLDRNEVAKRANIYNEIKNTLRINIKSGKIFLPMLTMEDVEDSSHNEDSLLYKYLKQIFLELVNKHDHFATAHEEISQ